MTNRGSPECFARLPGGRGFLGVHAACRLPPKPPQRAINSPASFPRATNLGRPVSSHRRGDLDFAPAGPGGLVLSSGPRCVLETAFVLIRLVPLLLIFSHEPLLESNPS